MPIIEYDENNRRKMPFEHVVIHGIGLMGIGIGQCCLLSGYKTWLIARSPTKAESARREIETFLRRRSVKLFPDNDIKAQEWLNDRVSCLHVTTDLKQSLIDADIFIEAVIENREIKQNLFAEVEQLASNQEIVLVSNTSSMRLVDLGEKLKRPELLGGLHFFSPVPSMKIVEVIKSEKTSDNVINRLEAFGKSLDKTTIICKDSPGFLINRMILPLLNISHVLVDENVASPESIDIASKLGMNLPLGLLTLSDMIGLDTIRNANEEMMKYDVMELKPSKTLDKLVSEGRLGRKTGCGFFEYTNKAKESQKN